MSNIRKDDRIRILHMLEAAEAAQRFVAGRRREDLDTDQLLFFALVRAVEVIGEAASKLSPEFRSNVPDVAWGMIVSMRNRLVHAYFDIDPDKVWNTAMIEIPLLLPALRAILAE